MNIKQIVLKAVELKTEAEKLQGMHDDKGLAQTRLQDVNTELTAQQTIVNTLLTELKALL